MPCVPANATIHDTLCGTLLWRNGLFVARADAGPVGRQGCGQVLSGTTTAFQGVSLQLSPGRYHFIRE